MTTPSYAIRRARVAGFHDREQTLRDLIGKGLHAQQMYDAYAQGVVARLQGIPCQCRECTNKEENRDVRRTSPPIRQTQGHDVPT